MEPLSQWVGLGLKAWRPCSQEAPGLLDVSHGSARAHIGSPKANRKWAKDAKRTRNELNEYVHAPAPPGSRRKSSPFAADLGSGPAWASFWAFNATSRPRCEARNTSPQPFPPKRCLPPARSKECPAPNAFSQGTTSFYWVLESRRGYPGW